MAKPFDLTRVKNAHNKKRKVTDGFNDPITWISTGNYALNKMISGEFNRGIALGAVTVFAGESGSSKSYIVSGNIVRHALEQGVTVVLLDTEDALKATWMRKLGVDPKHPNLVKYVKSTINDIATTINDFVEEYREDNRDVPRAEQPKILFVVDSLGFVESETEVEQFNNNELKGDKGIKAKMLKMLVANCIRLFAGYEIGLVATNHTYKSQDQYVPEDVISGGSGFIFAASTIVLMKKKKLKAEEVGANDRVDGRKVMPKDIVGITADIKCVKTRFAKPFESVAVQIPYETGMDPYSGLFDMMDSRGLLARNGSWYSYTKKDGSVVKLQRKDMDHAFFDMAMAEFDDGAGPVGVNEVPDVVLDEDGDAE